MNAKNLNDKEKIEAISFFLHDFCTFSHVFCTYFARFRTFFARFLHVIAISFRASIYIRASLLSSQASP